MNRSLWFSVQSFWLAVMVSARASSLRVFMFRPLRVHRRHWLCLKTVSEHFMDAATRALELSSEL